MNLELIYVIASRMKLLVKYKYCLLITVVIACFLTSLLSIVICSPYAAHKYFRFAGKTNHLYGALATVWLQQFWGKGGGKVTNNELYC